MDFAKELKGLSVRLYNTYGIHCDSARLALLAAKELERLAEDLRRLHAENEALKQENQDLKDDLRESDYAQQMGDNHE